MRRLAVVLSAGALALAGCGTGAKPYPPTGIDELVIPMPSPRATHFVDRIDNVWLPLTPGRAWTYDVRRTGYPDAVRTVRVLGDPVEVDGVSATAVSTTTVRPGERPDAWTDYYAQDTRGNVWWLGRADLWQAGREGARAGLVMAAEPRLGDGYRAAYEKGVVEDVVTVAGLVRDQPDPTVTLEWASALSPGSQQWDTYRSGVGLVDRLDTGTGEQEVLRP
ncbi:hypothetical protein [Nocardioides nematodiphilus]|uniref:hypothetical protein n=1 Tax=Nocardioides nematodiphilus TaxID=2849669 RepID=UPI001CD9728F|nr:hypothetical protein [Nocardioides nematodiphilus]MCA1983490.1 hypothetical protein [Nocardioides nematodiphilus]